MDRDPGLVPQVGGLDGFVLWTGWLRDGVHPPMWLSEGRIGSSASEPEVAAKIDELAQQLGGRVVGDAVDQLGPCNEAAEGTQTRRACPIVASGDDRRTNGACSSRRWEDSTTIRPPIDALPLQTRARLPPVAHAARARRL